MQEKTLEQIQRLTHRHVQEFTDSLVASRSAVRHGEGEHSGPPEDGVLVQTETVNQSVRLLQTTVHGQGDP